MTVQYNHMVPMRDGIRLATDIYRPDGLACGSTILLRTPYGKRRAFEESRFSELLQILLDDGFTLIIQDCRGRWQSEGRFFPLSDDGRDGWDTIDWIIAQPWSNGRVATYGCSYLGENQVLLAALRHPAHAAAIAESAGGAIGAAAGIYNNFGLFENGVLSIGGLFGWAYSFGTPVMPRLPVETLSDAEYLDLERHFYRDPAIEPRALAGAWKHLPAISMMRVHGNASAAPLFEFIAGHEVTDTAWSKMDLVDDEATFNTPTLHVNAWYDYGVHATIALHALMTRNALSERARTGQGLLIFPSSHCSWHRGLSPPPWLRVGGLAFSSGEYEGRQGTYAELCRDWFRHYLREDTKRLAPPVQVHVMGLDRWVDFPPPLPDNEAHLLYLGSALSANSRLGDGVLSPNMPSEGHDSFLDDPNNPVPSLGGDMCCLDPEHPDAADSAGPHDQSEIELRHDILVYTSAPLEAPAMLIGAPRLELFVASTAVDTDICVKLVQVDPDGRAWNLTETVARCRYRHGLDSPRLMTPGKTERLEIRMHEIAVQIPIGSRLRIDISGTNFPRFARNLHVGGDHHRESTGRAAITTLHFGSAFPSNLRLPVRPTATLS